MTLTVVMPFSEVAASSGPSISSTPCLELCAWAVDAQNRIAVVRKSDERRMRMEKALLFLRGFKR
jgi:hypothetical protein